MVWSKDDPATEAVAQIDDSHTAAEPNHTGESCSKCHDKDIVLLEECEVANDSHPHQESGGSQKDGTEVIGGYILCLDADFDETASDSKDITDDEEDIPAVNKLKPVSPAHFTIQRCLKELHKLPLQYDASYYGASAQHQRQHAHQNHNNIKCQTCVRLNLSRDARVFALLYWCLVI